ncbi:hypothetical protein MAR_014555 [Mya arenaria]|uniref:Uncharacterized protein n=1 Tax=Mya arenaria TaxID=6604 RepID=A0ABY7G705_MYAAR|nr:hypothetical protein MAR_014555 [Mya arenaria]
MAASMQGPISSPTHYDASFKVDIQIHQPLLSSKQVSETAMSAIPSLTERYIQSQGLQQLFPRAVSYLQNPGTFSLEFQKTDLDRHDG